MRVLLIIDSFGQDGGGAERQMSMLASLFSKENNYTEVITFLDGDFFKPADDKIVFTKFHYKRGSKRSLISLALRIRKHLHSNPFDVVISFMPQSNLLNCLAGVGGAKWKIVTSERSAKSSRFKGIKGKISSWLQRYSDALVCNSYAAQKMWLEHCPSYKNKLHVIYNSIAVPEYSPPLEVRKGGKTHLIVAATYRPVKNTHNLIRAVSLLSSSDQERLKIDWYGATTLPDGRSDFFDQSIQLVKELGLESVISLHPSTDRIFEYMQTSDAVGLFSQVEGMPNCIAEGMSLGKPIIMTRVSDYELLVDEKNGFLCDWDELESIKSALSDLVNASDQKILSLGEASYDKAVHLFPIEKRFNQWKELIESLLMLDETL